ncbi:MAG: substrate-binding domain-containing protein [Oscillospiraceae bacterium]|nr:substrate-binding domain-containing protein [Oscillospiraceae bacterium]
MKKLIALLLAACMLVAVLSGCGSSAGSAEAPASAPAEEAASAAAPAEEAAPAEQAAAPTGDFVWNGQKEVWSILPTTDAEGLVWINDSMGAVMEAQGFTYVKKDAQGDPGAQVQFVEQAIAAGNVGCLMIAAMSVEMLKDVVGQAVDAGIAVAYLGAQPTDYTIAGCVYTAYEITGMYAVQAAEYWAEHSGQNVPKNADGKYEIAIDTYYDIADGVYRSNAIKGTVEKSDTLTLVSESSSYGSDALNTAFNNAQAVLNANPDCHIFVAYEPQNAMGINNAIMDYCEQTGNSPADYFVAPCYGEDTTFTGLYEEAAADPAANAIKGYSTYGDPAMPMEAVQEQFPQSYDALAKISEEINPGAPVIIPPILTGMRLADILLGVCGQFEGYEWTYGETYYDTITAVTVDGFSATWSMGDENPAAEYKK